MKIEYTFILISVYIFFAGFRIEFGKYGYMYINGIFVNQSTPYKNREKKPTCFKSNPGPQSQAENCCEDCELQKECY